MTNEKGLETLQVWQKALTFAAGICTEILPRLPQHENWSLAEQLRRAVQSIPANIAEGYGRYYYQDCVRFCYIARGSLEESFSHITLAQKLGYLDEETMMHLRTQITELRKMINGYIAFLKQSKRGESEPGSALTTHEALVPYDIGAASDDMQSADLDLTTPDHPID
jgi:four helix bundle protein